MLNRRSQRLESTARIRDGLSLGFGFSAALESYDLESLGAWRSLGAAPRGTAGGCEEPRDAARTRLNAEYGAGLAKYAS